MLELIAIGVQLCVELLGGHDIARMVVVRRSCQRRAEHAEQQKRRRDDRRPSHCCRSSSSVTTVRMRMGCGREERSEIGLRSGGEGCAGWLGGGCIYFCNRCKAARAYERCDNDGDERRRLLWWCAGTASEQQKDVLSTASEAVQLKRTFCLGRPAGVVGVRKSGFVGGSDWEGNGCWRIRDTGGWGANFRAKTVWLDSFGGKWAAAR